MSASRKDVPHANCEMRSWQLQIVNTMCASAGDSNTAAQASGQRSVVSMANEGTVKSYVAPAGMLGTAVRGGLGSRWLYVYCLSGCKQLSAGGQDLLHCSADCEVSRESGTYSDSVIAADHLTAGHSDYWREVWRMSAVMH